MRITMTKPMNRIEKLIEEFCPQGVEFRALGDLEDAEILKFGRGKVISKKNLTSTPGDYLVYSSSAVGSGEFGRNVKNISLKLW